MEKRIASLELHLLGLFASIKIALIMDQLQQLLRKYGEESLFMIFLEILLKELPLASKLMSMRLHLQSSNLENMEFMTLSLILLLEQASVSE